MWAIRVTTVAGTAFGGATAGVDGMGAAARFVSPRYIVSDGSGQLYISDTIEPSVRILNAVTLQVDTLAGNGTQGHVDGVGGRSGPARVDQPRGLTSDGTSVYVAEFGANTVRQMIPATLDVSTLVGVPGTSSTGGYAEGVGSAALFDGPFSAVFHFPSNSLFVTDGRNDLIRRIR